MTIIGIDPGQKGGYAFLTDDQYETHPWDNDKFVEDL